MTETLYELSADGYCLLNMLFAFVLVMIFIELSGVFTDNKDDKKKK